MYQNGHVKSSIAATETKTGRGMIESGEAANGQNFGADPRTSRRGQEETGNSDEDSQSSASIVVAYSQPVAKVLSAPILRRGSSRIASRGSSRSNSRSASPVSGAVVVASNQPVKHRTTHLPDRQSAQVVSSNQPVRRGLKTRTPDRRQISVVSSNQPAAHQVSQFQQGNVDVNVNNQQYVHPRQHNYQQAPNTSRSSTVNQTIINQHHTRVVQPPPSQPSTTQQVHIHSGQQHQGSTAMQIPPQQQEQNATQQQQHNSPQQYIQPPQQQQPTMYDKVKRKHQKQSNHRQTNDQNNPPPPVMNGSGRNTATINSNSQLNIVQEDSEETSSSETESQTSPRKQYESDTETTTETESGESDAQPQRGGPNPALQVTPPSAHRQNGYVMVANDPNQQGGAEYGQSNLQGQMILSEEQRSNRPVHNLPAQHQLQATPQKLNTFSPHTPVHFTIGK